MQRREILPNESGVLYRSPSRAILWAFEDLTVPEASWMLDVLSGEVTSSQPFYARRHRVYVIELESARLAFASGRQIVAPVFEQT